MNKNEVLELVYEIIKESVEWSGACEGDNYSYWISGVIAMADKLIDNIDN